MHCSLDAACTAACIASAAEFLQYVANRSRRGWQHASTTERVMHGMHSHLCTSEPKAGANFDAGALLSALRCQVAGCSLVLEAASVPTRHLCRKSSCPMGWSASRWACALQHLRMLVLLVAARALP